MSNGKRAALLVALVVIAVVGFIVLKPDDTSKKQAAEPAPAQPTTTTKKKTEKPKPPPIPKVTIKDGKPVGGVKKLSFDKGERVRFVVESDVSDEIHVHGYDLMKDVEAGSKVTFAFPAKIDGVFEVELEDRGEEIASLEVQP